MNIRIVTFLSSDDEAEIKDLVADFCECLIAKGFANQIEDTSESLKSLIVIKENKEILETSPEVFFNEELAGALMTVIPTNEQPTETETNLIKIEEKDEV